MVSTLKNYKMLIAEISEEVEEGVLLPEDKIQILRSETPLIQGYCPVKEWYYDAYTMKEETESPMEEMYMRDEFSEEEWEEMKEQQEAYKIQYEEDQPKLVEISVKEVLTELKQMTKLLGGK